jgi:hypothetical protein
LTADRVYTLPDKSGTVAMTSDIPTTSSPSFARKASDQSSTSTALADVSDLSFNLSANVDYRFEFLVSYVSSVSTEGLGLAVNGTGTLSSLLGSAEICHTTTGGYRTEMFNGFDQKVQDTTGNATGGANQGAYAWVTGVVRFSTAGTFTLRFATETGSTNSITIKAGSWAVLTPLN